MQTCPHTAIAHAHANIAVAKYWGKRNSDLNLPCFDSVSFSVDALNTTTQAHWSDTYSSDALIIDDHQIPDHQMGRISRILDDIRKRKNWDKHCRLTSTNNFPHSSGLASSASGYAAAAVAASVAADLNDSQEELSRLARLGSGSAARSIAGGWVRWHAGHAPDGSDSFATSFAPPNHWPLQVFVVMISDAPKPVSSTEAMLRSQTSPFWEAYCHQAQTCADLAEDAIKNRDFLSLADVMHQSALMLHALTLSCQPPICYFAPKSIELLQFVLRSCRALHVCCTLDAGANVVVLCEEPAAPFVKNQILSLNVPFIQTTIGGGATVD